MTQPTWIIRTLTLTRAMSRTGFHIPMLLRNGLLTLLGRMRMRGELAANNDNRRGAA